MTPAIDDAASTSSPTRRLTNRHIQFIAIGGAIGAGLFLGSGKSIASAGPAAILIYAACGAFIFFMARALGELTLRDPSGDAFVSYATRYIGSAAGFITGWSYWANWILVGATEITATSVFVRYWYPTVPQWVPAAATLASVYAANIKAVRVFGEIEFWLAIIKILTIVLLIGGGLVAIVAPSVLHVEGAGFSNLFDHGGFFPHGWVGIVAIVPIALFAFGGVEVIALTAREAKDPERSIPRAINGVVFRILFFYVGSMIVAMSIAPWTSYSAGESPFVAILTRIGIPAAAGIVNFVVLTAVVSSCNTGLFSTGRMLAGLARQRFAPASLGITDSGLPRRSISVSAACLALTVVLNWLIPDDALSVLMAAVAYLLLWVWMIVLIAHRGMRRRLGPPEKGVFAMPLYPASSWATMAFIASATLLLVANSSAWIVTLAAGGWFAALALIALSRRIVPVLE
ncbi:amino acid permease [Sphingomonas sp. BK580]|uniref:amino acid permease n=1 Tax=Sphingomonas sp. BK580 TaxID=2586972 RepID=UPI00160EC279|nr:amino acid permease [Sphingomonas sp. BK580]MBB3694650.1 AAT family amino acid transporter/D-serine/D-alanine/glycine transporter [Sphingomonas sp. BK580]